MHSDYSRLFQFIFPPISIGELREEKEANEFPPMSIGELREEKEENEFPPISIGELREGEGGK